MQIETFKVFRDLVRTASFSKAAELNSITQSAVSQQIRSLEKKFRVALIKRGKKSFSITPEGRAFLAASEEIMRTYDGLSDRLETLQTVSPGHLRIATVQTIGLHALPGTLREFRKSHPTVEIIVDYLRSEQVYQQVAADVADLGLVAFPNRRKGIAVEIHWKDKMLLICPPSHRFATRRSIDLASLAGERFISFALDQPTRKAIDRMLRAQQVEVRRALEFDSIETLKRAVVIEHGIAIVPANTVSEERKAGTLVGVEIQSADMWRPIGLLRRRGRVQSPAARVFTGILQKNRLLSDPPSINSPAGNQVRR